MKPTANPHLFCYAEIPSSQGGPQQGIEAARGTASWFYICVFLDTSACLVLQIFPPVISAKSFAAGNRKLDGIGSHA